MNLSSRRWAYLTSVAFKKASASVWFSVSLLSSAWHAAMRGPLCPPCAFSLMFFAISLMRAVEGAPCRLRKRPNTAVRPTAKTMVTIFWMRRFPR